VACPPRMFYCCAQNEAHCGDIVAQQPTIQTASLDDEFTPVERNDWLSSVTPRQQRLRERIWLPSLRQYPNLPTMAADDSEDAKRGALLHAFQDFVLDLYKGLRMTQLTASHEYSQIHCQLAEDLQTLRVDRNNGCIIEFPLGAVSKVYRVVRSDDKWYNASNAPALAEHIVVIEFARRKLAFVFVDMMAAQHFLFCTEMLVRRSQEVQDLGKVNARIGPRRARGRMSPLFSNVLSVRDPAGDPVIHPTSRFSTLAKRSLFAGIPWFPFCSCEQKML